MPLHASVNHVTALNEIKPVYLDHKIVEELFNASVICSVCGNRWSLRRIKQHGLKIVGESLCFGKGS